MTLHAPLLADRVEAVGLGHRLRAPACVALALALLSCGGAGGIHARMSWSETDGLVVRDVPAGGPSYQAGLRPGDRIVAIDSEPVRLMSMKEAVKKLRGDAETTVALKIVRGNVFKTFEVVRKPYELPR